MSNPHQKALIKQTTTGAPDADKAEGRVRLLMYAPPKLVKAVPRGPQMLNVFTTDAEIKNGGIEQLFWNASGDLSELKRLPEAYTTLGLHKHATLMREALRIYETEAEMLDKYLRKDDYGTWSRKSGLAKLSNRYDDLASELGRAQIDWAAAHGSALDGVAKKYGDGTDPVAMMAKDLGVDIDSLGDEDLDIEDEDFDDDEPGPPFPEECKLRSARDIARRAICHSTVVTRSIVEMSGKKKDIKEQIAILRSLVNTLKLQAAFWEYERDVMDMDAGEGVDDELISAVEIETEKLQVLNWALGALTELPPPHKRADIEAVMSAMPMEISEAGAWIESAKMRPVNEIEQQMQIARLWQQRLDLRVNGQDDDAARVAELCKRAVRIGAVKELIEQDLPYGKRAFSKLKDEKVLDAFVAINSRFEALTWITGRCDADGENVPSAD